MDNVPHGQFNLNVTAVPDKGFEKIQIDNKGNQKVTDSNALMAQKITVSGDNTYVAVAPVGSAQASAVWQVKKVNSSAGTTTITWADGNINFDNVATDLTSLSYS